MKIAYEIPIVHLKDFPNDAHYILAHLAATVPEYREFYTEAKGYKILDNGTYETGSPLDFTVIMKLARQLKVDTVVLPDKVMDFTFTWKKLLEIGGDMRNITKHQFKWMIVPQIESYEKWPLAYGAFVAQAQLLFPPEQLIVGFPIWLDRHTTYAQGRIKLFEHMKETDIWNEKLPHHYLGVDTVFGFSVIAKHFESVDTSLPIKAATLKSGTTTLSITGRYSRQSYYFQRQMTTAQIELARKFMVQFEKEIKGGRRHENT